MKQDLSVFQLLATQAGRTSEAIAIVAPKRRALTYGRLHAHVSDTVKMLNTPHAGKRSRLSTQPLALE